MHVDEFIHLGNYNVWFWLQWEPTTLDRVDDEKLNLVFKAFEDDLELQIPKNEELRYSIL